MAEQFLDRVFAGWRIGKPPGIGGDDRPNVDPDLAPGPSDGRSLFEAIEQSGQPDEATYILARRSRTFAILNVFPYTSGHLLVLPIRAVPMVTDLDDQTHDELWRLVRDASIAVKAALKPEGLNVGVNEGVAGGGSIPEHLHVHVVPRWSADTNFMTSVANARVLPVSLAETWAAIRAHWPAADSV